MKMKKLTSVVVCVLVILSLVLTACGDADTKDTDKQKEQETAQEQGTEVSKGETEEKPEEDGPFTPYDPPITLTTFRSIEPNRTYMPGETWDNNIWTQAYERELGIKFEYVWAVPSNEFESKLNVAIASGDLPDFMVIPYNHFYRLARAGALADLTEAYDKYMMPEIKQFHQEADGGMALKMLTYDGKLYGISRWLDFFDQPRMLWYRDDWMENLGLEEPKTFDDVIEIARAFAKNDPDKDGKNDTFGFVAHKGLWGGPGGLDAFFNAYDQYPTIWIEKDGKLEYGGIQPRCKNVLAMLADFYKEGLFDPEFPVKDPWTEIADDVVQEKFGLTLGPIWWCDWKAPEVMVKHPKKATWTSKVIPKPDGSPTLVQVESGIDGVACINKNCKYPEAAIKLQNISYHLMQTDGRYHDQKDPDGNTVNNFFHNFAGVIAAPPAWNYICAKKVIEALEKNDPSDLNDEQRSYYDRCLLYLNDEDMMGYASYGTFGPDGGMMTGGKIYDEKLYYLNKFLGPSTETMTEKMGLLKSKQDEIFVKIITGEGDVETLFNEWLDFWNTQGGPQITEEVNQWYADFK